MNRGKLTADDLRRVFGVARIPKKPRRYAANGEHYNHGPPPLFWRRPELFDGTWRTPQQRKRDEVRDLKRMVRRANKGKLVKAELI